MAVELLEVLEGRRAGVRLAAVLDPDLEPHERLVVRPVARACALYAAPRVLGTAAADVVRPW